MNDERQSIEINSKMSLYSTNCVHLLIIYYYLLFIIIMRVHMFEYMHTNSDIANRCSVEIYENFLTS